MSPNDEGNDDVRRFFEKYCRKPIRDFWCRGWVGGGGASTSSRMVSGIFTVGGFGRDTVERRRALSRPVCESTLEGCDGFDLRVFENNSLSSGLMVVGREVVVGCT